MGTLFGKNLKKFLKNRYNHDFEIVLILENIQYARNVAEIFRIADAVKVRKIYLTGISHTPPFGKDLIKVSRSKEKSIEWEYKENINDIYKRLKRDSFDVIALELHEKSLEINEYLNTIKDKRKIAIVVGNEGYGVTKKTLSLISKSVMLPMYGKGSSLNVSVSLAVLLYFITNLNNQWKKQK